MYAKFHSYKLYEFRVHVFVFLKDICILGTERECTGVKNTFCSPYTPTFPLPEYCHINLPTVQNGMMFSLDWNVHDVLGANIH